MRRELGITALLMAALPGCGSKDPTPVVLRATGGLEGGPFAGTPAVSRVELRVRTSDGAEKVISTTDLSASSIEVPEGARTGIGALALRGVDGAGKPLAYGRTPLLELEGLSHATIEFVLMVQRHGTAARVLHLPAVVPRPRMTMLGERFLLVGDASSLTLHVVDLLTYTSHAEDRALEVKPATLATAGGRTLALDETGAARLVDVTEQTSLEPAPPTGFKFAEVAGGASVRGEDGAVYVVGCTRSTLPATDAVLRLDAAGTFTARRLSRARGGCAATFVPGRGLAVIGGKPSPSGSSPGVELLAPLAGAFVTLPFADDVTEGAVAAPLGGNMVVRVSPDGKTQRLDLACAASCAPSDAAAKAEAIVAREGDVAIALEGGSVLISRGGKIALLDATASSLRPLLDAGAALVSATLLSTGAAALVSSSDDILRTVLGDPR